MWPGLRWGCWAIGAIIAAIAVFAIAESMIGFDTRDDCTNRGGSVVEYDCPMPRQVCTFDGRTTVCADYPCKWRCVEPGR